MISLSLLLIEIYFFNLKRLRRLLCGEDTESLLKDDSVLGVLIVRGETGGVSRSSSLGAFGADLSHGILLAMIAISEEHLICV